MPAPPPPPLRDVSVTVSLPKGCLFSDAGFRKAIDDYDMLPGRVTVAAARKVDKVVYAKKSVVVTKVGGQTFAFRYVSQNPIEHTVSAASVRRMAQAAKKAFCAGSAARSLPSVEVRLLRAKKD
nr:hypothetical protein TetV2_00581 [Oceanusvirus sp.]